MIDVGEQAPEFSIQDQNGNSVRLSDFVGKRVILSFHPLAWTSVCAKQMRALEANGKAFDALNVVALGISDMHGGDLCRHRRGFDMHTLCCVIDPNRELCPQNALAHSALADARWQLEWLVNIVKKMDDWAGHRSHIPTNYPWPIIQKVEPELRSGAEIDALNSGVKAA